MTEKESKKLNIESLKKEMESITQQGPRIKSGNLYTDSQKYFDDKINNLYQKYIDNVIPSCPVDITVYVVIQMDNDGSDPKVFFKGVYQSYEAAEIVAGEDGSITTIKINKYVNKLL